MDTVDANISRDVCYIVAASALPVTLGKASNLTFLSEELFPKGGVVGIYTGVPSVVGLISLPNLLTDFFTFRTVRIEFKTISITFLLTFLGGSFFDVAKPVDSVSESPPTADII